MSKIYRTLDVAGPQELVFGRASRPVRCGLDLVIGGGVVFPEVNFTLPPIEVNAQNWPEIVAQYHEMADNILKRAVALAVPGIEGLYALGEGAGWSGGIVTSAADGLRLSDRAVARR